MNISWFSCSIFWIILEIIFYHIMKLKMLSGILIQICNIIGFSLFIVNGYGHTPYS